MRGAAQSCQGARPCQAAASGAVTSPVMAKPCSAWTGEVVSCASAERAGEGLQSLQSAHPLTRSSMLGMSDRPLPLGEVLQAVAAAGHRGEGTPHGTSAKLIERAGGDLDAVEPVDFDLVRAPRSRCPCTPTGSRAAPRRAFSAPAWGASLFATGRHELWKEATRNAGSLRAYCGATGGRRDPLAQALRLMRRSSSVSRFRIYCGRFAWDRDGSAGRCKAVPE